ncbi:MAG: CRISPR-associated endoribonuclease Cas6 [Candidatus Hodarchaeaceae archaeon]|nr:CRISPR-associated endoribonuclease Cas6 [Candidatus Hodarchaeaceae archaeon]
MRLLLKLRALKDQAYDLKYHHKLQGFIYDLLDGTPYEKLHNRKGYKFFCFSNIFPPEGMRTGVIRNLLISSPDLGLIEVLNRKIAETMEGEKPVNVGEMSFKLEEARLLKPRLERNCMLITGTPIVIRIPKEDYEKYGIKPPKDYDYVYWRKRYSFEAFIKQLEDNLFKKYNEFYGGSLEKFPLFEQFMFKKQVCNHVVLGGNEVKVFGSVWEFAFSYLNEERKKLLQFGLDCGLGELNSMGFGFINVEIPKAPK